MSELHDLAITTEQIDPDEVDGVVSQTLELPPSLTVYTTGSEAGTAQRSQDSSANHQIWVTRADGSELPEHIEILKTTRRNGALVVAVSSLNVVSGQFTVRRQRHLLGQSDLIAPEEADEAEPESLDWDAFRALLAASEQVTDTRRARRRGRFGLKLLA